MKKAAAMIVSILFVFSLAGISFAQVAPAGTPSAEKAKGEDKAAKPEKKAEAKKKAPAKKTAKPAAKEKKAAQQEPVPAPKSQVQQQHPAKPSDLPEDVQREMGADVVIDIPKKK
jgi:outer membrane biosynthesis protein TonB